MRNFSRRCLLAAIILTILSAPSWAQERNIRRVTFVTVKFDRIDEWKAVRKDYIALLKKAGWDQPNTVWASQNAPNQFGSVAYFAKWAELEPQQPPKELAADFARVVARRSACTETVETWVDQMQPDLTIQSSELPKVVRTSRLRLESGKLDGMLALLKNEAFPAIKKSGATSWGVALARFGTPTNEIHTYLGLNGWADMDEPIGIQKGMSAEAYKAYLAKASSMLESVEYTIWRFQPELSYLPEKK
jgi:hypothetical protein